MPLGLVVDANSNATTVETYALVLSGVVVNTVSANLNDINAIKSIYDYCVDLTQQGQAAGIGWTYDATHDVFGTPPPPPTDWVATARTDFNQIIDSLQQCVDDAGSGGGSLTPTQLATAFAYALNDNTGQISDAEFTLLSAIYTFVLNGG